MDNNPIWYIPPRPIEEIRALDPSPVLIRAEHRSHIQDLAAWLGEVQRRSGRTVGSLLASEQRQYDKRMAAIRELEALKTPTMTAGEALLRFETGD